MTIGVAATCVAAAAANITLGGAIYEALLVDRAWPETPSIIQPARGGIDRRVFWLPAHLLFELPLFVAIWATWRVHPVRSLLLFAMASHFALRAWSLLYFIPLAVKFERAGDLEPQLAARARTWVRLSRWRIMLQGCTLVGASCAAFRIVSGL